VEITSPTVERLHRNFVLRGRTYTVRPRYCAPTPSPESNAGYSTKAVPPRLFPDSLSLSLSVSLLSVSATVKKINKKKAAARKRRVALASAFLSGVPAAHPQSRACSMHAAFTGPREGAEESISRRDGTNPRLPAREERAERWREVASSSHHLGGGEQ